MAPSNLSALGRAKQIATAAEDKLIYSFCGTAPIYVPPNAVPYTELRPAPDDPNVLQIAEALYTASPAFGLCEMLPENASAGLSDKFALSHADARSATVQQAAASVAVKCKHLYTSINTNSGADVPDAKLIVEVDVRGSMVSIEAGAFEFKASMASSVDGLPQAYEAAAVMASNLYHQELPLEDVVVPFSAYTAAEELHGVVYVLEGGAPCFAVLAINRLDMTAGCVEAARWRMALVYNGRRIARLLEGKQAPLRSPARGASPRQIGVLRHGHKEDKSGAKLLLGHYFVKQLTLWNPPALPTQGAQRTMYHESLVLLEMFEKLREGGVPAPLPLARLTTGTMLLTPEGMDKPLLPPVYFVFEDLAAQGFWSGVPAEEELFLPWLLGAMDAVRLAHAAGVVHLDTHMHNFMWREVDGDAHMPMMCTPPGAKPTIGRAGHKEAARLASARKESRARMVSMDRAGGAGGTAAAAGGDKSGIVASGDETSHFCWLRAGDVAAKARQAREAREARLAGSRKVEVVLVDWDLALSLSRPARMEDVAWHELRTGWCQSLRGLRAGEAPPTAPDWDMLRTVLALWLRGGPEYQVFVPLARRTMQDEDWQAFADMHRRVAGTLPAGGLGAEGGLQATLAGLLASARSLDLDRVRLERLLPAGL
jgi:hypothetical protein